MKVQQGTGTGPQIATIVKTPGTAAGQTTGSITFPLQLSQVKTVNKVGGTVTKQAGTAQQVQQLSTLQQHILLQRQKQQQQQQLQGSPSKMGQVSWVWLQGIVIVLN